MNEERGTRNEENNIISSVSIIGNEERGTRNDSKIKTFFDLDAWQESHNLCLLSYKLTKSFPNEELYGLTSQLRRAAVSVTSNIAEGFSRESYSYKCHFYTMAHTSISELISQAYLAKDLTYIKPDEFDSYYELAQKAYKILGGLIKATKERK
ncbi:four helix bundle protein [Candidatus Saccharibacteria bacterium]|nr:MAG: four helix bundle protein [Candidatus Saccharibacteria bacterium]